MHHRKKFYDSMHINERTHKQTISQHTHFEKTASMSNKMTSSLHTLRVELVYRILDHLNEVSILLSCSNVCTRLDAILNTYHPYQVIFSFIINSYFHHVWITLSFLNVLFYFKLSIPNVKRQISSDSTVYLIVFLYENNAKGYVSVIYYLTEEGIIVLCHIRSKH
jgi:hypothetical protein